MGPPSRQIKIPALVGGRRWIGKGIASTYTFALPICARCARRIWRNKLTALLLFALVIGIGFLFPEGDRNRDMLVGIGVAFEISLVLGFAHNLFDPAMWWQGRYKFNNEQYLRLFREANPSLPAEKRGIFDLNFDWGKKP